jgi:hypothetical protein
MASNQTPIGIRDIPNFTAYSSGVSGYDNIVSATASLAVGASANVDTVIPSGEKWHIQEVVFSKAISSGARQQISNLQVIWDPATANKALARVFADGVTNRACVQYAVVGNGTKVLRQVFTNLGQDASVLYSTVRVYREVL